MEAQNTGVWIAMAAILVQAPRLVLAVLAADHQAIAATWERALLILAGCGTALVLTGGNLYLPTPSRGCGAGAPAWWSSGWSCSRPPAGWSCR